MQMQHDMRLTPTRSAPLQVSLVVVAHGMGCRLIAEALGGAEKATDATPGGSLRCIFAAPDAVPDRFLQRLTAFPANSRCAPIRQATAGF